MGAPFNKNLCGRMFVYANTGSNYFNGSNDNIYTFFPFNDTIYNVNKNNGILTPILIARIGERCVSPTTDAETCDNIRNSDTPRNIFSFYDWDNIIMFSYNPPGEKTPYKTVVADIENGKVLYCGSFKRDKNNFPINQFSYTSDSVGKTKLLSVVPADHISIIADNDKDPSLHPLLHEIAGKIDEESNPVFIFYDYIGPGI